MDNGAIIPFQEYSGNLDFGIADFMDNDADLDQFIDLIREEDVAAVNFPPQPFDLDGGCLADSQILSAGHDHQLFGFSGAVPGIISPDCSEFPNEDQESSETTTNSSEKKLSKKSDRSTSLISERRRRGRMKEKLYALRSLVPNITKMDKASIIGDAVLYVQDLQMQAKKLKSEIAGLHSSFNKGDNKLKSKGKNSPTFCPNPTIKKIFKIDAFAVEEGGFYVRIVTKKGKGVAPFLHKALHSLTPFNIHTSNLSTHAQNYVFVFTLHIAENGDINLSSLKKWVAKAFLEQGFCFETSNSV